MSLVVPHQGDVQLLTDLFSGNSVGTSGGRKLAALLVQLQHHARRDRYGLDLHVH